MLSLSLTRSAKILKFRAQHAATSMSFRGSVTVGVTVVTVGVTVKVFLFSYVAEQVMIPTVLSPVTVRSPDIYHLWSSKYFANSVCLL